MELNDEAEQETIPLPENDQLHEVVAETLGLIKSHFEISVNDFICLALETKKRRVGRLEHLVGQVVAMDDDLLEINFLSKNGSY